MKRLYTPPDGFSDQPFLYIFEGAGLVDGNNYLNQDLPIVTGWGDFILRRILGLDRILSNSGAAPFGSFQFRDSQGRYLEEVPQFVGTGGKGGPMCQLAVLPEVFYPETGSINFDLVNVLRATDLSMLSGQPIYSSQLGFHGIRRVAGADPLAPKFKYREKSYTYVSQTQLQNVAFTTAPQIIYQKVSNYDFELLELRIFYAAGSSIHNPNFAFNKVMLYDQNSVQTYSAPALDLFVNRMSYYQNGAVVPPLLYRQNSQIRMDFTSLISDSISPPLTATIHYIGKQRIPCS